jgi:hypothetical protein
LHGCAKISDSVARSANAECKDETCRTGERVPAKNTTMSRSKCRSVRLRDLHASRFAEHSKPNECFYEKVIKVKADVAALHSADLQASPDELKAAILLFYGLLDEQQRRLFAGLESIRLGHGRDTLLGDFLGLDVHTVARGRRQLLDQNVVSGRSRRTGGGRTSAEKKRPT